jgi:hypothetical protein
MSTKKYKNQDVQDIHGPMNSVAKADAMVWAGVSNLETADDQQRRVVQAKKQKAKIASKKQDRRTAKEIIKHIDDTD